MDEILCRMLETRLRKDETRKSNLTYNASGIQYHAAFAVTQDVDIWDEYSKSAISGARRYVVETYLTGLYG